MHCKDCGRELDEPVGLPFEQRSGCPDCGGTARRVDIELAASVRARADLGIVAWHGAQRAKKRAFRIIKTGAEFFRLTGQWHQRKRDIDRDSDRYRESIHDETER